MNAALRILILAPCFLAFSALAQADNHAACVANKKTFHEVEINESSLLKEHVELFRKMTASLTPEQRRDIAWSYALQNAEGKTSRSIREPYEPFQARGARSEAFRKLLALEAKLLKDAGFKEQKIGQGDHIHFISPLSDQFEVDLEFFDGYPKMIMRGTLVPQPASTGTLGYHPNFVQTSKYRIFSISLLNIDGSIQVNVHGQDDYPKRAAMTDANATPVRTFISQLSESECRDSALNAERASAGLSEVTEKVLPASPLVDADAAQTPPSSSALPN